MRMMTCRYLPQMTHTDLHLFNKSPRHVLPQGRGTDFTTVHIAYPTPRSSRRGIDVRMVVSNGSTNDKFSWCFM